MKPSKILMPGATLLLTLIATAFKTHLFGHTAVGFYDKVDGLGCCYTAGYYAYTINSKTTDSPAYKTSPTGSGGSYTVTTMKRCGFTCVTHKLYRNGMLGE
jgi:hypothetical protein